MFYMLGFVVVVIFLRIRVGAMRFSAGFITMNCTTIWEKSCYFLQASKGSNSKLMIEWMMKYIEIGENGIVIVRMVSWVISPNLYRCFFSTNLEGLVIDSTYN